MVRFVHLSSCLMALIKVAKTLNPKREKLETQTLEPETLNLTK